MSGGDLVLGLDPATTTGWVVLCRDTGNVRHHGAYSMEQHRFESQGMKYLRFEGWLRELLTTTGPYLVGFEEVPSHRGVHAAHRYGGIVAIVMKLCDELGVPYTGIPIATWKREATGKGNANKKRVAAAFKALGLETDDGLWVQDEIDAYFVAVVTCQQVAPA
jgi:Holliday junction resolvasome RuvABC endonuclease subunit